MYQESRDQIERNDHEQSEEAFQRLRSYPDQIRQVAIDLVELNVVIPRLSRPEPNPSRASNKRADEYQRDPHNEAPQERTDRNLALLPGVITNPKRIRIDVRKRHQPDDDQAWHHHARDPRVEIHEHFLEPEEVPRRFRRVHREIGIRRFLERRVKRDRPHVKNHSDDDDREKFDPKKVRPYVKLSRPVRTPRPRLAMMRLGQFGISLELVGELVVRARLMKAQPKKERHQK